MNFLHVLSKMGVEVDSLRKVLELVANGDSDLSESASALLVKLEGQVPAETITDLASVLPAEILKAVTSGHFGGGFHPSSGA